MSSKMLHDLAPISTPSCPSILSPATRFLGATTTFFLLLEHTMIISATEPLHLLFLPQKHTFSDFHTDGSFFQGVAQMSPPLRSLLISLLQDPLLLTTVAILIIT